MDKIKESWSLFKLNKNGKNYIVRCNSWLWNMIADPKYPYKVGIAIPLEQVDENGFPTKKVAAELYRLEDTIIQEMQKAKESLFAGSITGGEIKEFFLYTSNISGIKKKLNKIKNLFKNYELQLSIVEDKNWDVFKQLCPQK